VLDEIAFVIGHEPELTDPHIEVVLGAVQQSWAWRGREQWHWRADNDLRSSLGQLRPAGERGHRDPSYSIEAMHSISTRQPIASPEAPKELRAGRFSTKCSR
jgi:hypothetical protein